MPEIRSKEKKLCQKILTEHTLYVQEKQPNILYANEVYDIQHMFTKQPNAGLVAEY